MEISPSTDIDPTPKSSIRKASVDDAHAITQLLRTVYSEEARLHEGKTFSAAGQDEKDTKADIQNNTVLVAEINGEIVGTITLYDPSLSASKHEGDPAELLEPTTAEFGHFAIIQDQRHTGLGEQLLAAVQQHAQGIGVKKLALVTRAEEPPTHLETYYRNLGFQDTPGGIFTMPHLGFPTIALVQELYK